MSMHPPRPALLLLLVCAGSFWLAPLNVNAETTPDRPGGTRPIQLTKPRIPPLTEAQWTEVHRKLVATFSRDGRPGNDLKTLLRVPEMVEALMPFNIYVSSESSLSPRHREILILRTAWLCGNEYLWSTHAALAKTQALTSDEIRRIAQGADAPGWDQFEATLIRLSDQLYRNSSVNEVTWKTLAAGYDLYHLMDAVMTVADFVTLSLMYNAIGVQPDEGNSERLPTDVPYRVVVSEREPALQVARVEPIEGPGLAISRTFARYPKLAEPRALNSGYVNRGSKLSPRYREMLILRTGWNAQSEYEWAQHVGSVGRARDYGLDPIRIAEGPDAPGWDPFEATVLRAADELYRDATVSERTWNTLAERFDSTMMMNVIVTASNYRMVSMALNALGVQIEPGNERFPKMADSLATPHFHHIHMNSVDPSAAIAGFLDIYPGSTRVTVAQFEGLKTANNVAMLFTKVSTPPPAPGPDRVTAASPQTAFWHHVWSAQDARAVLQRLRARDPAFDTKTFIPQYTGPDGGKVDFSSDTFPGFLTTRQVEEARQKGATPTHTGGYFNWYGPDGVVMETSDQGRTEAYRIVGMFQEQPYCAVLWYREHLNAAESPASGRGTAPEGSPHLSEADCKVSRGADVSWPSTYKRGHYRNPPAQSVYFDDVQLRWYMNQEDRPLAGTRGQLMDHLALGVTGLDAWIAKLKRENVKFLEQPYRFGDTRAVLIEGPGREAIELVETQ
jgi:4-carboxymuconolactone decarboxylase